jgi:hypothetical protein
MISKADFPKLDMPPNAMQVTDPRTGETGYRVGLEVFHQLHCLNLLRMSTYPEYYTKLWWSDTNDKPEKVRAHLGTFAFLLSTILHPFYIPYHLFSIIHFRGENKANVDNRSLHRNPTHEPHVLERRECVYVPSGRGQGRLLAELRESACV